MCVEGFFSICITGSVFLPVPPTVSSFASIDCFCHSEAWEDRHCQTKTQPNVPPSIYYPSTTFRLPLAFLANLLLFPSTFSFLSPSVLSFPKLLQVLFRSPLSHRIKLLIPADTTHLSCACVWLHVYVCRTLWNHSVLQVLHHVCCHELFIESNWLFWFQLYNIIKSVQWKSQYINNYNWCCTMKKTRKLLSWCKYMYMYMPICTGLFTIRAKLQSLSWLCI